MSSSTLEFALKKQRLQLASDQLRARMGDCADGLAPAFHAVDLAADGVRWLSQRPLVPVAIAVAVAVARPRMVWRWVGRVYFGWGLLQRWRRFVAPQSAP